MRELFAYLEGGTATLQNTAPLTGTDVRKNIVAKTVSSRPHAPDFASATATCKSDASSMLSLSGCIATATKDASKGGAAVIDVSAGGFSQSLTLHVWHPADPSLLSLQLDDAILSRLAW